MIWAGTLFGWASIFSSSMFDSKSAGSAQLAAVDPYATMSWRLSPGAFLVRRPEHLLRVSTTLAIDQSLVGNNAGALPDAQIRDMPLRLQYTGTLFSTGHGGPLKGTSAMQDPTLLGKGDHRTWFRASGFVYFPTSKDSQSEGLILTPGLGASLRQQIKLLGSDAAGLTHLLLSLSESWSHPFHQTQVAVLQGPQGEIASGTPYTDNILVTSFDVTLPLVGGLELATGLAWRQFFRPPVTTGETCVTLATGTDCFEPTSGGGTVGESTAFYLGFSYLVVPELAIELGYQNTAAVYTANGSRRDPFSSPNAGFYTDVTFSFDRLYERLSSPRTVAPTTSSISH